MDKVNQKEVLNVVLNELNYSMVKDILVKPLPVKKVMKNIVEQIPTNEVDEDTKAFKYETKEYTKEVDSVFREGVVLALPSNYEGPVRVGDKIVFPYKFSIDFDLYRDSMLVKPFDVIGILKEDKDGTQESE